MIPRLMLMALAGKAVGEAVYYGELYKAIMDDSPLAYWRLGEPVGIEVYDEVGTYQGNLINTPTLDITGALSNSSDTAMTFASASSEYIEMGDILDFDYNKPFSLECWFKTSATGINGMLVAKRDESSPNAGYDLYQESVDDYLQFVLQNTPSTNALVVKSTASYNDNNWHHCVLTYNGSTNASGITLYIDGLSINLTVITDTLSATTSTSKPFQIGARDSANHMWNGSIDDAAIYGVELTQSQIAHHYWAGKSAYADPVLSLNPVGYWRLGESSGTNAKDETGNNDGTYTNTPTLGVTGALTNDSDTAVTFASASSEYVTMGDVLDFERTDSFSLECWFKSSSATTQALIAKELNSGTYRGYSLFLQATGEIGLLLVNDNGTTNQIKITTVSSGFGNGAWHHAIITYDGTSLVSGCNIYIDSELEALTTITDALSATTLNAAPLQLGTRDSGGTLLDGSIDEAAVYDYELTTKQVHNNYWAGKGHRRYSLAVLADDPISYWRLGESGTPTTAVDVLGTNDGTYTNTPTVGVTGPLVDDSNTAITLTAASSEYVTMGDVLDFDYNEAFSLECWFKTTITGVTQQLICKQESTTNYKGYGVLQNSTNDLLYFRLRNVVSTNDISVPTGSTYNDGNWHHCIATYDGSTNAAGVTFYVDGVDDTGTIATDNLSATTLTTIAFQVGARDGTNTPFDGSIDEPAIYDYELTAAQALTHYLEGLSRQASKAYASQVISLSPVGYWRLGESGTPTTAVDQVGSNDGTYTNTPTVGVTGALTGDSDTAVTFAAASSEYVTMGDVLDFDYNEAFSLECWYKPSTSPGAFIISKQITGGNYEGYGIYQAATGEIRFLLRNTLTDSISVVTDSAYSSAVWRHIVITYDGSVSASGVTIYINGASVATTTSLDALTATTLTTASFMVASRDSTSDFDGSIDEPAVYDYELSANQVKQNYLAGAT